jgi:hypothetical protein
LARAVALKQGDAAGDFLHEEIEIAVAIGIHQLRTGRVESAQERETERPAGGVGDREGEDGWLEGRSGGRADRRTGGRSARLWRPRAPCDVRESERAEK